MSIYQHLKQKSYLQNSIIISYFKLGFFLFVLQIIQTLIFHFVSFINCSSVFLVVEQVFNLSD